MGGLFPPPQMILMTCSHSDLHTFSYKGNPFPFLQVSSRKQTSTGENASRSNFLLTYSGRGGCENTFRLLPNLQPNVLVLLVPRGHWNLGRVLEVHPGPDGMVRTVKDKSKDSVLIRPIQKLCLLENDFEMV